MDVGDRQVDRDSTIAHAATLKTEFPVVGKIQKKPMSLIGDF